MHPLQLQVAVVRTAKATAVKPIDLLYFLKNTLQPDKYFQPLADKVQQYRATGNKALKQGLPAITPAALLSTRAGNVALADKLQHYSGFMQFDIDQQENPDLQSPTDAEALRDALKQLPEVAFVGLSASGAGVWGLVWVKHPERLKEHYQELVRKFDSFGITLDKSKGGNPTDLRFYSYDPNGYINPNPQQFTALPAPKPRPAQPPARYQHYQGNGWQKIVQQAVQEVASATDGQKHNALNKAAYTLGGLVGTGAIGEQEAQQMLEQALQGHNVKDWNHATRTIQRGLQQGANKPLSGTTQPYTAAKPAWAPKNHKQKQAVPAQVPPPTAEHEPATFDNEPEYNSQAAPAQVPPQPEAESHTEVHAAPLQPCIAKEATTTATAKEVQPVVQPVDRVKELASAVFGDYWSRSREHFFQRCIEFGADRKLMLLKGYVKPIDGGRHFEYQNPPKPPEYSERYKLHLNEDDYPAVWDI